MWGSHFGLVYSLMKMFVVVYSIVGDMDVHRSMGPLCGEADTCLSYLFSYDFIFNLCLMKEIFEFN